jgi:predicted transcriptional regulator
MRKRIMYNNHLNAELMKKIRILAARMEKRHNDLIEEAIQDLIKKYKNQDAQEVSSALSVV